MRKRILKIPTNMCRILVIFFISSVCSGQIIETQKEAYSWRNVAIGGGGAVLGVLLHPKVKDLVYIRTDVGGIYRRDEKNRSWIPLLDWIPFKDWNLYGVESFAIDPSDSSGNTIYISVGKYSSPSASRYGASTIMKSTDRGNTWIKTPIQSEGGGANDKDKFLGERLAVDPLNGRHIFYASREKGLFESIDAAASWTNNMFKETEQNSDEQKASKSLCFVIFDPYHGYAQNGFTKRIYVGVFKTGVFLSDDGGRSWTFSENSPKTLHRAAAGTDGNLFVTHSEGIAKFDGNIWTDVTPEKRKGFFIAIAIDVTNPSRIITAIKAPKSGGPVFLSDDGGRSWDKVSVKADNTVPWWIPQMWLTSIYSLSFDPFNSKRVWATDWYGVYKIENVDSRESYWTNLQDGHEEVVDIGALAAPPASKYRLYSGLADVGGFDHEFIDTPPSNHLWNKGFMHNTTTGIAWQASDPDFLVRVGCRNWDLPNKAGAYTINGGDSWIKFQNFPYDDVRGGRVLIAGKNRRIIWFPQIGEPYLTDDLGNSWRKLNAPFTLNGVARGHHIFFYEQPAVVDLSNPDRIYIHADGKLLRSDDAGNNWNVVYKKFPDCKTIFSPGIPDEVWLAEGKGLWRSTDAGISWAKLHDIDKVVTACTGKNPPGKKHAAVFLCGTVKNIDGYYRSDDLGSSWIRIDDSSNQRIGNDPHTMCGDWRTFGGVFVGTGGRGLFYGSPNQK